MLARCVATLKPPPELTLSQWADRYRMLSAESSAEPGRWHTDKAPYQREIMDAIGDAHIRRVVIMCAAQLGKTELLLNILGYFMAYEVVTIVVNNLLEIVFAVLGASFTALVIPWLKDTGLPWLKEKRLYSIVKKFVEAAEKQAEAGTIDKATKKRFVVELLEANGITVTPEINAFIEAAVKELDLAEKNAIGEIGKIFSDAEQTPQN